MAIAYDNSASGQVASGASVLTYSHTVGAALSNGILIISVVYYSLARSVSTITYNGVSCTKILRVNNGAQNAAAELWYLLNPSSGANSVVITLDAAATVTIFGASVSLSGVSQVAPEANTGTVALGAHTTHSDNITTIANNAWVVDVISYGSGAPAFVAGGSQNSRQTQGDGTQDLGMSTLGPITPAASTAVSWSFNSTGLATAHAVASFAPAAAGGLAIAVLMESYRRRRI